MNTFAAIDAMVNGNTITVTTDNVLQYTLNLDANLLDSRQPVTIISDGLPSYAGAVRPVTLTATLHR